ncbi:Vacuolar protein sorting-associated protein 52 A [Morella rubra]|uniref:Vacuolar protein sorting-associated protein 52 A n=1 Tax=Morella rubra TaxID=262757 RepID=A0A6A1VFP8_9ROSI|nr:Vacuolar protein sorting-associated protein 52 A [Morella rubra]
MHYPMAISRIKRSIQMLKIMVKKHRISLPPNNFRKDLALLFKGEPYVETNDVQKNVFDLGAFVGDLTIEEDASSDDISLEGLQQELEECRNDEVVANILSKGTKLREYTKGVENNLRQVELDSIQDYIQESDNLVSLHDQIHECDSILSQMETLLSGFQALSYASSESLAHNLPLHFSALRKEVPVVELIGIPAYLDMLKAEIGSISSDIKFLQEKSMDMGLKLKNRKVAESKLAKFVEDIIVPPRMVDVIVDGEVNDEYMRTLEILSKKLKFVEVDPMVKAAKALKDVQPELEKLRQKAVSKVFDFIVQKLYALRKPKTNIQILQQNVLLKYKTWQLVVFSFLAILLASGLPALGVKSSYFILQKSTLYGIKWYVVSFLKEHGNEIYIEVRGAYIDTMNKVLSAHFRAYIQALEKLQLDIATYSDLIGVETRSTVLFLRGREPLKNRSAVFALGERIKILKEIDEPALIPHIAEASSSKYPYEVLFRSLHKLLMDTATSEYNFCDDFFGEESIFFEIFAGPFAAIDEHFNSILPNCYDAIGLMLMIRIVHQHQVNIALWPRFKMVFDMHLNSLRNANMRTLWEDDVHPHYVMRRYAEFTASLIRLNVEYGDGQLDLNLERLRMAVDDLLIKLAKIFPKTKLQIVFLINNYDMTISVLKEASSEGGKIQMHFEELLKSNTALFVEELLLEHFSDLIKFVKTRASEDPSSSSEKPIAIGEVEPLVKDFASRWKAAIELMHKDVITSFSSLLCGMEILRAALTQLLLYYTRLSDCIKRVPGGSALNKDLVSISSIMYEIRKYSRTF